MSVDTKNIIRTDLQEIYNDCKERTFRKCLALKLDPDSYAISGHETGQLHLFALEGASKIANHASMIKYHSQTGIDALSFYQDLETPEDADSYVDPDSETANDETVEDPDGNTILVSDIAGREHESGEKLSKEIQDLIVFQIDDLEEDYNRYTVVQQFIKSALTNYILYKWWELMGQYNEAKVEMAAFMDMADDVRFNAVSTNKQKNVARPYYFY